MERFVGNLRKVGTFKLRGFSDENFILKKKYHHSTGYPPTLQVNDRMKLCRK